MNDSESRTTVCMISCVGQVQNMRVVHFLKVLAANGYRVMAIRPGVLTDPKDTRVIVHYPLPAPTASFWYHASLFNLIFAIGQRLRNSFLLSSKLIQVRPDIIICCEPDSWAIAVLAKFFIGSKVVADLREVYHDRALAFPKFGQSHICRLLRALMQTLSRYTDEVIHVSLERQQVYSYLHKPGIVIGSYPELHLFPSFSVPQIESYAGSDNSFVTAIHVGALRSTYASEQLLYAMDLVAESYPRIRFVIVGGIDGMLKNKNLVESLKQLGVLEYFEHVPFPEVVRKLLVSDIGINLVLPVDTAHRLAAPQKLYEYFAASLPVIAADVPTIRRVVTEYECGLLVDSYSPKEIADALVQLAQDAVLRKRMGQNARRAAETEYNWESQGPKLCLLVQSLSD